MPKTDKKGFSIVELVVTISVLAIMAAVSSAIIVTVVQLFFYMPRQATANMITTEVMDSVIEGSGDKRGIRYSLEVIDASPTQFTYTFGYPAMSDRRNMRFRWDAGAKKIKRSYTDFGDPINGTESLSYEPEEDIVRFNRGDFSVTPDPAAPGAIFSYYKSDGSAWVAGTDALNTIARVNITVVVSTGSGAFSDSQGSIKVSSSVEVRQYI